MAPRVRHLLQDATLPPPLPWPSSPIQEFRFWLLLCWTNIQHSLTSTYAYIYMYTHTHPYTQHCATCWCCPIYHSHVHLQRQWTGGCSCVMEKKSSRWYGGGMRILLSIELNTTDDTDGTMGLLGASVELRRYSKAQTNWCTQTLDFRWNFSLRFVGARFHAVSSMCKLGERKYWRCPIAAWRYNTNEWNTNLHKPQTYTHTCARVHTCTHASRRISRYKPFVDGIRNEEKTAEICIDDNRNRTVPTCETHQEKGGNKNSLGFIENY